MNRKTRASKTNDQKIYTKMKNIFFRRRLKNIWAEQVIDA